MDVESGSADLPDEPTTDVARRRARLRAIRRTGATAIAAAGVLDLASALTPPLRDRLHGVDRIVPLAVPRAATALVALAGLALILLARGVRRGQRLAWRLSVGLLIGSAVLHLIKGIDVEEALVALGVVGLLVATRSSFRVPSDRAGIVRGAVTLGAGLTAVLAAGTAGLMATTRGHLVFGDALGAVGERLIGLHSVDVPPRVDRVLRPTLAALGFGLAAYALWICFSPVRHRRRLGSAGEGTRARARELVRRFGGGTLDYFTLRDDKHWWFRPPADEQADRGLVAYAQYSGIALVSPDPLCHPTDRTALWDEFLAFADAQGWTVAVVGAGDEWLPIYEAAGMGSVYTGDEAIVDCQTFSLEGKQMKELRQAANRIARHGYRMEFHDPATLDRGLRVALRELMTKSRRGDVERGFSMTLGRIFDPRDDGLLLAVCFGPDDTPVAFCQYVPAATIDGYSLDLMRRDDGEHPNGVTDFVVVETIRHLRDQGMHGLGLNFSVFRNVLTGDLDSLGHRVLRFLIRRFGDDMQIESLWRFNSKFRPRWVARYGVYDASEQVLPSALAIARAESFSELPVIGRLFVPAKQDEPVS